MVDMQVKLALAENNLCIGGIEDFRNSLLSFENTLKKGLEITDKANLAASALDKSHISLDETSSNLKIKNNLDNTKENSNFKENTKTA